jgi:hypothetical protein
MVSIVAIYHDPDVPVFQKESQMVNTPKENICACAPHCLPACLRCGLNPTEGQYRDITDV